MARLKTIWRDRIIALGTKVKLRRALVISINAVCMRGMETECRPTKEALSSRNQTAQKTPWHLIQGPCHQEWSPQKGHSS
ncbi:hypothetical protein RRG08_032852 [Elysia crispata]|uniref:Uncharacterized protein n=1 Tax=Elysia crispata TaxID=231223 RepID=A0AAE1AFL5_9GAST|nr:hypothetical protein RRG08_032852 [Elysia crispata]